MFFDQELSRTMLYPKDYDEHDELLLACIRDGTTAQASSTLGLDELGRYIGEELDDEPKVTILQNGLETQNLIMGEDILRGILLKVITHMEYTYLIKNGHISRKCFFKISIYYKFICLLMLCEL